MVFIGAFGLFLVTSGIDPRIHALRARVGEGAMMLKLGSNQFDFVDGGAEMGALI